jgi:hypothetical protein
VLHFASVDERDPLTGMDVSESEFDNATLGFSLFSQQ